MMRSLLLSLVRRYSSGSDDTGDFALDDIRIGDCLTAGCSVSPNEPCIVPGGTCDHATGRCAVQADGTMCDPDTIHNNFSGLSNHLQNVYFCVTCRMHGRDETLRCVVNTMTRQ